MAMIRRATPEHLVAGPVPRSPRRLVGQGGPQHFMRLPRPGKCRLYASATKEDFGVGVGRMAFLCHSGQQPLA